MKCLILNPKGGVAKTTVATQLLAPYIYNRFSKSRVPVYSFDLHNDDVMVFKNSKVIEPHLYSKEKEISELIDEMEFADNAVLDLGGNESTKMLLDSFAKTGTIGNFDLIVSPFGDSDADVSGTVEVYQRLKKEWDFTFLAVLSRACNMTDYEDQFFHYFGDKNGIVDGRSGLREKFDEKDQSFAVFPTDSALVLSRVFGETIYELSLKDREKYLSLKEKAKKNHNKKDFIKANKILRFYEYCSNFTDTVLKTAFKTIDNLLANEND